MHNIRTPPNLTSAVPTNADALSDLPIGKSAIHIAIFSRLEQMQLASANPVVPANAVVGAAGLADIVIADANLGRR